MANMRRTMFCGFSSILKKLCGMQGAPYSESTYKRTRLAWFGGFPAHYMAEFHRRLEARYEDLRFVYVPFGVEGSAFSHEVIELPSRCFVLPKGYSLNWVWQYMDRLNPDAVLIAGNYPRANLVAAAWASLRGRNLYYLADSNPLDGSNLRRNWLNRLILVQLIRRATKILSIGTRNSEFYLELCGKESLGEALLNFPLPHLYEPFEAVSPAVGDRFVFLVFGRLDPVKAVDRIINAYALMDLKARNQSRLLIAGDGDAREGLELLVDKLNLRNHVEFRGSVPSSKAPQVFGEANALVTASHDEPWGLVVNEALSAGLPVIGPFWIGAFADLVIPRKTGIVTNGNAPEQLAPAMQELLDHPGLATAMGQTGRLHVREHGWTIDGSLRAFDKLLSIQELRA